MPKNPPPSGSLFDASKAFDDEVQVVVPTAKSLVPSAAPEKTTHVEDNAGMDRTALVFLDDPVARKLAVAWNVCNGREAEWFDTAGLSRYDQHAQRVAKALQINRICRTDGTTDPLAMNYIQAVIAKPLSATLNKRKGDRA